MNPRTRPFCTLLATLSLATLIACGGDHDAPPTTTAPDANSSAATPPPAAPPTSSRPPSSPPATAPSGNTSGSATDGSFDALSSRGQRVASPGAVAPRAGGDGPVINAPGARFTLPDGWQREAPSSAMRLAQARVDGAAGPGQLTVFHFGPGGGGEPAANLQRWVDQMTPNAGVQPTRGNLDYGPFRVSWVDVVGTLRAGTMGIGNAEPQPDSRLLGAVVEGPGGPWFFKVLGPDATLDAARDDFMSLIRSAQVSS